ncbi:uncharacterized protein K452DRAFT_351652 [Aplosporella prunicola CBS 121167]|uniref:Uncharacterized protein n=1 Tax=Aplosporella prunicola CBS 121167 TaxID=1176127 RepID=A0A6A6BBH6_9PEZI|nr:uncharacterized protein K452DRAFT_351652 [Aplosporella prunicola CBS 121167]KAF2140948.1 hypothetical protein K452DRAFT_351652 [Aplosporella prunicola CBS 121167]
MDTFSQNNKTVAYNIYTGYWINWSKGHTLGATITLDRRDGSLLIAFLAMFVSVVGTSFWRISCLAFHSLYSTEAAQDALYHQRQAILRNSANSTSGLWSLLNVLWVWRRSAAQIKFTRTRPYQRILPIIGLAAICIGGFGTAGTFSSSISTAMGNEVLVRSPTCGLLQINSETTDMQSAATYLYPFGAELTNTYTNYARNCITDVSDLASCKAFIKRQLPTKIDRNASCPFQDGICKLDYGNIVFDTGYLDSHFDFGINAPPNERILFRRISSCAPIKTDGYQKPYQDPETRENYTRYYYTTSSQNEQGSDESFTYEYPQLSQRSIPEQGFNAMGGGKDYTIGVSSTYTFNGSYSSPPGLSLIPIPELEQPDADIHIIFLSANRILYAQIVDDPWFSAHRSSYTMKADSEYSGNTTTYQKDEPVSALACSIKEQYCDPSLPSGSQCTRFGGSTESYILAHYLAQSTKKRNIFDWISLTINVRSGSMATVPAYLEAASLAARYKLRVGYSGQLPDNQWQMEVESWHASSLATLQGAIADTAKGLSDLNLERWLVKANNTEERNICHNQKIQNSDYFNISVFGLCFTLVLGTIVICLSYTLEPMISWIQRSRNLDVYARLEWNTNETLQLQRLAHEELGAGVWNGCASNVPFTKSGERLAVLDLEDKDHPRLKAPPKTFEETQLAEMPKSNS